MNIALVLGGIFGVGSQYAISTVTVDGVEKLGILKHHDPYNNGFPRWTIAPDVPEEVIPKVIEKSHEYSLRYSSSARGVIFNYALFHFTKNAIRQYYADQKIATRSNFESHYHG